MDVAAPIRQSSVLPYSAANSDVPISGHADLIWMTPAIASAPYTAEVAPVAISIRSMPADPRNEKSNDPPRVLVGSFSRTPSRYTAVKFDSAPRRKTSDTPPGPPGLLTEKPGRRCNSCSASAA